MQQPRAGPPTLGPEALCIGETMVMVTPEQPAPLEFATTMLLRAGGADSNVAMYLAGLGHRVGWVSPRLGLRPKSQYRGARRFFGRCWPPPAPAATCRSCRALTER